MSGIAGRFFKQFGWTAALAVLASLVVARMLTPMMAAYLLKDSGHSEPPEGRIMPKLHETGGLCLKHRLTTIAAAAAFFIGSLLLIPLLPTGSSRRMTIRRLRFSSNYRPRFSFPNPGFGGSRPATGGKRALCEIGLHHHRQRLGRQRSPCHCSSGEVRKPR